MVDVVKSRPTEFSCPEEAVAWSLRSGAMRNPESARVSIPSQIVLHGQKAAAEKLEADVEQLLRQQEAGACGSDASVPAAVPDLAGGAELAAESEVVAIEDGAAWHWRTNLLASEKYWKDWFVGLSDLFLSIPQPKLLVLAGTDRLDTDLTIAHMQGGRCGARLALCQAVTSSKE